MRSFIAIELPESTQSELGEIQRELKKTGADIRWVRPENIHLTLKFLGDIEEGLCNDITRVIEGACNTFQPFSLSIQGTGVFPNARAPRVVWVGLSQDTSLAGIKQEIDTGLVPLGFEQEDRSFVPHLTLGRFRSSQGKRSLMDKVVQLRDNSYGVIDVKSIALMRSDLSPHGARYTKIAEIPLGG